MSNPIDSGLPARKPDFMLRKYQSRRKKKPEPDSDEEAAGDEEWTPALERSRSVSEAGLCQCYCL